MTVNSTAQSDYFEALCFAVIFNRCIIYETSAIPSIALIFAYLTLTQIHYVKNQRLLNQRLPSGYETLLFDFPNEALHFCDKYYPPTLDTGRKLNVHKTFRTSSERLMYVQFTCCVHGDVKYLHKKRGQEGKSRVCSNKRN